MAECKANKTPANVSEKLKLSESEEDPGKFPYREAVGSLMYAMCSTRPDIAYAWGKWHNLHQIQQKTIGQQ
jgi:hypothetical protein